MFGRRTYLEKNKPNESEVIKMKAEIKNDKLVITLDLINPPRPSSSGKTLLIASTSGNQATTVEIDGKPVGEPLAELCLLHNTLDAGVQNEQEEGDDRHDV